MLIKKIINAYTLVEILVVVTLFALLGVVGTGLFSTILRGSSKANIINEVKQNGDYTLGIMERTIRNADEVLTVCDGSSQGSLILKNYDGSTITFSGDSANSITSQITNKSGTPASANKLTTDLVVLDTVSGNLSFICTLADTKPSTIKISFTLKQSGTNTATDQTSTVLFETTVALRNK